MKFIRIALFYVLFLFLCMIFVVLALQDWSVGAQMLFALGLPALLVWWREKRRAQQISAAPLKAAGADRLASSELPRNKDGLNSGLRSNPKRSGGVSSRRTSAFHNPSRKSGWVPAVETATLQGRDIGGMVYVGTPPRLNTHGYHDKCLAYIDPSLSVARKSRDKAGDDMPYWPGYSHISPKCRATYLDWLASGRCDASYNPGYMFLYFYGLERRLFVDQAKADAPDIIDEVRRLCSLYPDNHSVQRYLGEFLDVAMLADTEFEALEPIFERQGWDLPLSLKFAIGVRLDQGERLIADWLLSWFICHPNSRLRTAAMRCREEFLALFRIRFNARFPDGLKVSKPRKALKATYRAASSEFEGSITPTINDKPVPDISGLRKPVEIAQELADEVMDDLDKFSRFLGRNPEGRGSVEAHALLPVELWQVFPSEELEDLKAWAAEIVADCGLVSLENVIERLEGKRLQKIGKRQLIAAADALGRIGFGLAPDPRFALRSPKPEESVVIFDLGQPVEKLEEVSARYRRALIELALGTFVAHADGRISNLEYRALAARGRNRF